MIMNIAELKDKSIKELYKLSSEFGLTLPSALRKQDLIFKILQAQAEKNGLIFAEGVLETLPDGFGFLRSPDYNYLPGPDDVYVSPSQIRKFELKTGDTISGQIRPPKDNERYFALLKVEAINFESPEISKKKSFFDNLTPLYPQKAFELERGPEDISTRVMALMTPVGQGQRGLIVSPPRTGKTMLLQSIAHSITTNHPNVYLIVLLIDERPEEVTSFKRNTNAQVFHSSLDMGSVSHIALSSFLLSHLRLEVECGNDIVILIDSLTRMGRAYNSGNRRNNRTMSGGLSSGALELPRKLFGMARSIENGGSCTIIATILKDTGSRMDEVIFQEFKGTGNCEIILDRELAEERLFPAINIKESGSRKEELLHSLDEIDNINKIRRELLRVNKDTAISKLKQLINQHSSNRELLKHLK